MPIIKICQGQPSLAVKITTPGTHGAQLVDYKHLRLVIAPPIEPREELPLSPQHFSGFWPGHDTDKWNNSFILPEEQPLLIYPALYINDDGETVFRLDDQLLGRVGRYVGIIELNGQKILELDLDISTQRFILDQVTVYSKTCGE